MSDGDEASETESSEEDYALDPETFEERLQEARTALDEAETEADFAEVEDTLDEIEADLEAADLPDPDDEEDDPDDELATLRDDLEASRGPYAEDVIEQIEGVQSQLRETRWTERGEDELEEAVTSFTDSVAEATESDLDTPEGDPEALADGLDPVSTAISEAGLDPDEDAETIETLVDAGESLADGVEAAEEWDDLEVRAKLQEEGFYDSLSSKHKDFPPEWTALKAWEQEGNVEMILLALERFDSDFMERHCLEALERMGQAGAIETVLGRAERRDQHAVRILGKIGEPQEDVVETLVDFLGPDADPALEQVTLKALGEMGAEDAVQDIADRLEAEEASVRSVAARSLGLVGDARAIDPLEAVLNDDEDDSVRASATWALVQIGTESALEAASAGVDDPSYLVQSEAEPAVDALGASRPTA